MARLAAAVVVGVAAFVLSGYNPEIGLEAFSLTYGLTGFLDPTKRAFGTKLSDLKATQSAYGVPWPSGIEGAPRLAGNIIWASEKRAIANTQSQGKGGPKVEGTTYTYEIDVMWGLADQECGGLRRVWSNGALAWTVGDDADTASLTVSGGIFVDIANKLIEGGPNKYWRAIRFYGGAPNQTPDPTYEAAVGISNAPAYRGRTTVVVEGLNLGESGQLPVLTFEIVSEAVASQGVSVQATIDETPYNAPPFCWGVSAMSLAGYDVIAGSTIPGGGGITQIAVIHVNADGTYNDIGTFPLPGAVGNHYYGGSTDETLYFASGSVYGSADGQNICLFADGSYVYLTQDHQGYAAWDISKLGARILCVPNGGSSDNLLRLYDRESGALLARGPTGLAAGRSCALSADFAYYIAADSSVVYQFDAETLALLQTIPFGPSFDESNACQLACDTDGTLYVIDAETSTIPNATIYYFNGGTINPWTLVGTFNGFSADLHNSHFVRVDEGTIFAQGFEAAGAGTPNVERFKMVLTKLAIATPPLNEVVERALLATGQYAVGDYDLSALSGDIVRATVTSQVGSIRQRVEPLMAAYFFDFAEAATLRAVKRGGSSVVTIPNDDMAASADGTGEPLPLTNLNDIEVAAQVTITYANVANDFQDGAETGDRLITDSTAVSSVQLPIGLLPQEAKRIADVNTMDLAVSLLQAGPISISRKYAALETGDVVTLEGMQGDYRCRIVKLTLSAGIITLELVLDDPTVINSTAGTDSDYPASTLLKLVQATKLALLDIPLLRDVDNTPGFYAAFSGDAGWPGAELDVSTDGGTTFTKNLVATDSTVIGTATSALPAFHGGNVFDNRSTLTVSVGDMTLSSFSADAIRAATADAYLVGSEIVYAQSATLISSSPNVYRLSGFLRGERGTEWAIAGHATGERFVVLHAAGTGLRRVGEQVADIGVTKQWRALTFGQSTAGSMSQSFRDTAISLKPFAPVDLQGHGVPGGAFVFSWHRRSRLSSRFLQQVATPLGEATESYDVELRDSSHALKRSATVTAPLYSVSGLADNLDFDAVPGFAFDVVAGELIGIAGVTAANLSLVRLTAAGETIDTSPRIGDIIYQWARNGDTLYAVATDTAVASDGVSTLATNSTLQTFARTSISTPGPAISETSTPGDWRGVAFDGAYLWIALYRSNKLRKLDPTTLATIADYTVAGGPTSIRYLAGKLYVSCVTSREVMRWDVSTNAEDWRTSTACFASYTTVGTCVPVGSLLFVFGTIIEVRNAATGALVMGYASSYAPQLVLSGAYGFALFGGNLIVETAQGGTSGSTYSYLSLDTTTGQIANFVSAPTSAATISGVSVDGTEVLALGSAPGGYAFRTRGYSAAPPGFSGYTLTVYQNSATVGHGYPATLEIA